MFKYYDKNGHKIEAGMSLLHNDGVTLERVYPCSFEGSDAPEDQDLGFNATNYASPAYTRPVFYPLSQFDLSEWVIDSRTPVYQRIRSNY